MHKLLFGLAAAALVVAFVDIQAPPGSSAALEGGFLLLGSGALAVAGIVVWRLNTRRCPACAENVKRSARKCRHCGADLV